MNTSLEGTCLCSKAELELFTTPPVNVSMERGDFVAHRTLATITETSPLEFFVPGSAEEYIDLGRTKLHVKLKLTKADDTAPAATDKVSTTNLTTSWKTRSENGIKRQWRQQRTHYYSV